MARQHQKRGYRGLLFSFLQPEMNELNVSGLDKLREWRALVKGWGRVQPPRTWMSFLRQKNIISTESGRLWGLENNGICSALHKLPGINFNFYATQKLYQQPSLPPRVGAVRNWKSEKYGTAGKYPGKDLEKTSVVTKQIRKQWQYYNHTWLGNEISWIYFHLSVALFIQNNTLLCEKALLKFKNWVLFLSD